MSLLFMKKIRIGLRCNAIDIDSVSHLRRLWLNLNLGDESQLSKELSELTQAFLNSLIDSLE